MTLSGWIVVLAGLVALSSALPAKIHVGGLFDIHDEEQELAFRIAVDWLNADKSLLGDSRILTIVQNLHNEDTYAATEYTCGLLQKNITAIFGPRAEYPSMQVQSICDDLEVPHIESRWDYRSMRDILSINMYPHTLAINSAFVRLLDEWGWADFSLIYEEDEAIVRMKDILTEGEKRGWKILLYQFKNITFEAYRDTFWTVKRDGKKKVGTALADYHIVLDASREHLYDVMKAAQQVGMMTEHQRYLITTLDLHTINTEDFQYGKTNIMGLRLVQEETDEFKKLLSEVNIRMTRQRDHAKTLKTETALIYDSVKLLALGLEQMDTAKHFSIVPAIYCNQMNKGIDGTSLVNFMKNAEVMDGLTGVVTFDAEGFRSSVSFDVIYSTTEGLKKIGTYFYPSNSLNVTTPTVSFSKNAELEHGHFRITTFLNDPYAMLRESSLKLTGNDRFEGFSVDVLDALAAKLHFTYELHEVRDKQYGIYTESTKKWNGMIGEVVEGIADMAIADLTINTARLEGVDFTLPFMQTGIGILYRKPTEKITSLFSFLAPFSGEVWLLVMIGYTFVTLCLFLVGRISPYEWMNPHPCRKNDQVEENCFNLLNSMWFTIGSLMQQGSDVAPTAMSTRAVTSIWYFFCLIMISSYTANLAAFLTVEKLVSPFNNVDDLAKQDKIKYGCVQSGSTRDFFRLSKLPLYIKMFSFMDKHNTFVSSNAEGVSKVSKGGYAFFMETTSIEYKTERECHLARIGDPLDSKGYGIAIKKGNYKLRDWLSGGILLLQEEGKLHTFKEKWWKEKKGGGKCSATATSGAVTELGLGNVGGVFVVMLLGMILAACVAVIEFLWFQRKLQRDNEASLFKLLMKEIQYAISCGSSSKPAPKLKNSNAKNNNEEKSDFNSLY